MGFFDWLKETFGFKDADELSEFDQRYGEAMSEEEYAAYVAEHGEPESEETHTRENQAAIRKRREDPVAHTIERARDRIAELMPEDGLQPTQIRNRSIKLASARANLDTYGMVFGEYSSYEHREPLKEALLPEFDRALAVWTEWKDERPGWWAEGDNKSVTAHDISGIPGSRRRPIVDERLMPKAKTRTSYWEPKPRVLELNEAQRFFARGFRVSNIDLHRIESDTEQITRLGLPNWSHQWELAREFGLTEGKLYWLANERFDDRVCHYVQFRIPKKSGGSRVIMAPKEQLRDVQRRLLRRLVDELPVSDYAHGFRTGRSIKTNAEPHVGKRFVIGMDLEDFFGSVHFGRVRGLLIAYGYSFPLATTLALLMTEAERQPVELEDGIRYAPVSRRYTVQGAPTSPGICNAIAMKLDHRLAGLADTYGYAYTRYADDIAFSGDDEDAIGTLLSVTREIAEDEGFAVNESKTRVMHSGQRQQIAGVVVNEELGLSRKERRRLRAMIHRLSQEDAPAPEDIEHVEGKLAYLQMLNPDQAEALRAQISW
ncbi:MAG: reverse transcriptase family protein [Myxococcota bacterium]